ncbi:MAG: glycosyltransferase family 39 protein [Anaerolineae bacterium]|nr:glycosyltransferase family 39 protein [Anaerolineae bacterium]
MLARLLKRDWLLLALLLVVVTLIALPVLTYPLGRDQGEFATIGRGILNGRTPYTELWNPKPPAVFYIYALAMRLLGQTAMALRAIDFVVVPICCACIFWIGRRLINRRIGLWAALLFPVFYFTETFWTLTQNDGIVLVPMLLAMVLTLVASEKIQVTSQKPNAIESQRHRGVFVGAQHVAPLGEGGVFLAAFLAGALSGYIIWYKYPFGLFGVLLGVIFLWLRWQVRATAPFSRRDAYAMAVFIVGGLVTVIGGVLLLMVQGAWGEFLRSAQVTAQYTALTFNFNDFRDLMGTAVAFRWHYWGLLFVLALVGIVTSCKLQVASQSQNSMIGASRSVLGTQYSVLFLLLAWLLVGLIIMLVQAKGYDYHWLPMLPPLTLLSAMGIDAIQGLLSRVFDRGLLTANPYRRISTLIIALVLLLILAAGIWPTTWKYLTGQEDQVTYFGRFVAGEFVADESLKVAQLLRERVAPGDSLYIWGFRPEVYYLSGLNPATRFIFQFPLVGSWYPPEWRKENVDTLWAALPPYVLVLQVDYMPWVTGSHEDSNQLLQEYTDLNNWLVFNYERDTQIGNFFVWRRKQP